ncbi:hypothetical protein D3C73_976070 [compost metagenome]
MRRNALISSSLQDTTTVRSITIATMRSIRTGSYTAVRRVRLCRAGVFIIFRLGSRCWPMTISSAPRSATALQAGAQRAQKPVLPVTGMRFIRSASFSGQGSTTSGSRPLISPRIRTLGNWILPDSRRMLITSTRRNGRIIELSR